MRFHSLTENKDYALAKKAFKSLSANAQHALGSWEFANWMTGELEQAFKTGGDVEKEIEAAFEPIRADMKRRYGDTMTLYRGIEREEGREPSADRVLFSWTSSEKIARHFAGNTIDRQKNPSRRISDQEVKDALARYEKNGFTTFAGKKYIRNPDMPQYFNIYDKYNNFVTDGDKMERDFKEIQQNRNEYVDKAEIVPGEVFKKEIPIDDIIRVMMGGNANEYIVKGHAH